ncbi:MAG TPA: TatD family hydrolase [Steroidobacteraceae bacterium]|nr:TatD family hydrolase [Steroidobacteraceae bacterium]
MTRPVLVDIGANLAHGSFDADRDAVLARARAAGVAALVVTGSTLEDTEKAVALCRRHPDLLRATAGVHPHHATRLMEGDAGRLADLLADPLVVAAGECGLDYFRSFSPPAEQRRAFELQLGLAEESSKPLFLHQRDAHADFLAMLRAHPRAAGRSVLHCFTEGPTILDDCLALGLSIGVTGWICDERRGQALREAAPRIPADRLMLETDAPYLLPRTLLPKPPHRRNEPAFLPIVLEETARCRGEAPAALAAATTANACRFFGLTLPADATPAASSTSD